MYKIFALHGTRDVGIHITEIFPDVPFKFGPFKSNIHVPLGHVFMINDYD
jgi:hypothetical protein